MRTEGEKRERPSHPWQKGVNDEYVPLHREILRYESLGLHLWLLDPHYRTTYFPVKFKVLRYEGQESEKHPTTLV